MFKWLKPVPTYSLVLTYHLEENTDTSPAGRYLSIHNVWNEKLEKAYVEDQSLLTDDKFFGIIRDILHLAIVHNCPLNRWKMVHDLFLPKDEGNRCLERPWIIQKIDSERNLICREFVTWQTMKHIAEHKYLADKQHGGKEGRALIDIVSLMRFTTETQQYQQSNTSIGLQKMCSIEYLPGYLLHFI
eukprot:14573396-Ditylum_brightwellii.AAC.1